MKQNDSTLVNDKENIASIMSMMISRKLKSNRIKSSV